jgi:hypothetical protein
MANVVANVALGRAAHYASQVGVGNAALVIVLLQAAEADATLRDHDDLAALLAVTGNTEATFTNYCVDVSTECLTRRCGWTRYDELDEHDEILAYDPVSHTTRWERPIEVFVNPGYSGEMWALSMQGFSALTTPDHRWPVIHYGGRARQRQAEVRTTQTLPGREWALIRSAPFTGPAETIYSDAFVRIAAWYFTEGSLQGDGSRITVSQSDRHNAVNVEDIRRDLKALGACRRPDTCVADGCDLAVRAGDMCRNHYQVVNRAARKRGDTRGAGAGRQRRIGLFVVERTRARDELVTWDLSGTEVDRITACVPGKDKVPTMEFLSALTPAQARLFIDTCIAGDGSPEWRRFDQHDKSRMDAFTVAAVLAGAGPTLSADGTSCHLHESAPYMGLANVTRERIAHYRDLVWCPVLPSGHWVARRDGKVHITGNSRIVRTTGTVTIDDTGNTVAADTADFTWTDAGGATNNTLVKLLICYDPDTTVGTDADIIPLTLHDYAETTTGSTITATVDAAGYYGAS